MATMDSFNSDELSLRSLTTVVNDIPYVPTRTGDLGLFEPTSIATTTGFIDSKSGAVELIGTTARGTDGQTVGGDSRTAWPVKSARIAAHTQITAEDIQNLRAFGSESEVETVASYTENRLRPLSRSVDATMEYHRIQVVTKGEIRDTDGTLLLDLYNVTGKARPSTVYLDLANSSPAEGAIHQSVTDIVRQIEDELGGAFYEGIHCFVGPVGFDALTHAPETREAYARQNDGAFLRERTARRTFFYAGVTFEEYRGSVNGTKFVADGDFHFFPVGVDGLFVTAFAPADRMETVNTLGNPKYAFADRDIKDRFVDLEVQSNPINYCSRPGVLVPANGGTSGAPM